MRIGGIAPKLSARVAATAAPVLPNSLVFGEFVAHLSPKNHSLKIERVAPSRAYGPPSWMRCTFTCPFMSR